MGIQPIVCVASFLFLTDIFNHVSLQGYFKKPIQLIKADNIIMTSAIWVYYSLEIDCADINKLNDDSVSQYTIKENNVHHIIRCTAEYK